MSAATAEALRKVRAKIALRWDPNHIDNSLIGTITRELPMVDGVPVARVIRRLSRSELINSWESDPNRTHADVLALLDKAIAAEECDK